MLRIAAQLDQLEAVRRHVHDTAAALGADSDAVADMLLAVDEMATNVIVHGYRGEAGTITIDVTREKDRLVVRLRDHAPPFDPTTLAPPDITLPLHRRPLGGMGVFLTRQLTDQVIHRVTQDNGNELTLIKSIRGSAKEDT